MNWIQRLISRIKNRPDLQKHIMVSAGLFLYLMAIDGMFNHCFGGFVGVSILTFAVGAFKEIVFDMIGGNLLKLKWKPFGYKVFGKFDWLDLVADLTGILLGALLIIVGFIVVHGIFKL